MTTRDAIAPAGSWRVTLVEAGASRHPGEWIGPGYPERAWSPINVVVFRSSEQTILVDAGPGFTTVWPFEGIRADTEGALADAGVTPATVDVVVLTHLDYDHAGGPLDEQWPDDLGLAFPSARVVVHEDAIDAARGADPDTPDNVGTAPRGAARAGGPSRAGR